MLEVVMDHDIVSTSGEIPEKFIRELHRVATCVKKMFSSLYPSIILENNMAPNTQIGRVIIEDQNNLSRTFSRKEHQDMYSSDDEVAKYSRGGEFLENLMSDNILEFCYRWMNLGDVHDVLSDIREFYNFNAYYGRPIDYNIRDVIFFTKENKIPVIEFVDKDYSGKPVILFDNQLDSDVKKSLIEKIKKEALL